MLEFTLGGQAMLVPNRKVEVVARGGVQRVRHDMVDKETMLRRLKQIDLDGSIRRIIKARTNSLFKS